MIQYIITTYNKGKDKYIFNTRNFYEYYIGNHRLEYNRSYDSINHFISMIDDYEYKCEIFGDGLSYDQVIKLMPPELLL